MVCGLCGCWVEYWAEVRWPVRRGEESATRPPGLDQCLVSPGPVSRHCPGSATLSALSRRHSADRRGDDTVGTVTTQLELSSSTTTTQPRLGQHLHHHLSSQPGHNMELLLRQNSFDIHNKPPAAGGLFDREYPHPHYSQSLPACISHFSLGRCRLLVVAAAAPEMFSTLITLSL